MDYDSAWSTGELWKNLLAHRLWLWLLSNASHKERKLMVADHTISVMPGELITSYSAMAEGIAWSVRGVDKQPTVKQVQGLVSTLVSLGMIEMVYDVEEPKRQRWLHIKLLQTSVNSSGLEDSGDIDNTIETMTPGEKLRQTVVSAKEAFTYWLESMGKPANTRFTDNRKDAVMARLKNYSLDDIKLAIDGCRSSKWHMGNNSDNMMHNDLELICRDDEHLEQFMEKAPASMSKQHRQIQEHQERESRIMQAVLCMVAFDDELAARNIIENDDEWTEVEKRLNE